MTARFPTALWMRTDPVRSRPLASCLRHADANSAHQPWIEAPSLPAEVSGGESCPRCTELEAQLASLPIDRAAAVAAGHTDGLSLTEVLRARMASAIRAIEFARSTREDALTQIIVDIALGVCSQLAPTTVAIDARGLGELVRTALGLSGSRDVVLRLRTDDAAVLGGQLPTGIACQIDDDLAPGEVWVDAPRLVVDARWASRLAAIREPLLALVREAEPVLEEVATPVEDPGER